MTLKEKIQSEYFTEQEVADALFISRKTLITRRAVGIKHPPYIKMGRTVLYPKKEFDHWVKKLQVVREIA